MAEGNTTERHAVKRGEILRILLAEYPDYVSVRIIRNCLDNAGMPTRDDTLLSYLTYLEEKGYVRTQRKRGDRSRISIQMAAVTAKGLDLIDSANNLHDEGVSL